MKLTAKEKELILETRKQEDYSLPYMEGFLKEDLYWGEYSGYDYDDADAGCCFSKAAMEKIIKAVRDSFNIVLSKGTRFVAYRNIDDDTLSWFDDDNYGIENVGDDFAKQFLENIRPIKKKGKNEKISNRD